MGSGLIYIGFMLLYNDIYLTKKSTYPPPFYKKIKTENIYSVEYKKPYLTMLWNQTQNLPPEAFKMLEEKYREAGFFIEVRLQVNKSKKNLS